MVMMIAAPNTHAQTAPGPAKPAAFHAPNSQPEPMIEPRPVSMRANGPTSRRIALEEDIEHSLKPSQWPPCGGPNPAMMTDRHMQCQPVAGWDACIGSRSLACGRAASDAIYLFISNKRYILGILTQGFR